MTFTFTEIAIAIALGLGAVAIALITVFVGRRLVLGFLTARLQRRIDQVHKVLEAAQGDDYRQMDRLLFQLGEVKDRTAVREALDQLIEEGKVKETPLDGLYRSLGLVDEYIKDLRGARSWTKRANAARALGQLGVVDAIPQLLEALRDPQEDPRGVKTAVAEALAEISAVDAIPLLLKELEAPDAWASPRIAEMLVGFGKDAVPLLAKTLEDESHSNARVWAAQILGRIGDPAAVSPLIARMRDRAENVRMSVAEALGRLGDPRATNELLEIALRDPVPPVRAEAARALGLLKDPSVVENLITLFGDPDYWTRLRAVEAIEMIGPSDPAALDAALRDPSPDVRGRAAMALQRIGVLEERVNDLAGSDRAKVDRAHRTLVEMGRAGLIESILFYAEHDNLRVRSRIASVLGEVDDDHAVGALKALLEDRDWPVRVRAVEALARIRPPDVIALLMTRLSDDEESVRTSAVEAIRAIGIKDDDHAVASLISMFDTDNAEVRRAVVETLAAVQHETVDSLLDRALLDPNDEVRLRSVLSIESRLSDSWTVALIGQLGDPDTRVRSEVVRVLGMIGTTAALEGVTQNLHTNDRDFREALTSVLASQGVEQVLALVGRPRSPETFLALVWSLGKTESEGALPKLRELASHEDPKVRASVAGALGKIKHSESETILLGLLEDRDERTRAAAVNALRNVGSPAAFESLERTLSDPDPFVRGRVALALGTLGGARGVALLRELIEGTDRDVAAHAVVGAGLAGGEDGFQAAVNGMVDPQLAGAVERIVARLEDRLRDRFQVNLHLEGKADVSREDLAQHYAHALRVSQDEQARIAAVHGLIAIGAARHQAPLIDAVRTDPSYKIRETALKALTPLASDEVVSRVLVSALRDPATSVQVEAAHALGTTATSAHNPDLLACFRAADATLDRAVIEALAFANSRRVADFIDELMGYTDVNLLRGGALVLGHIGDPRASGILKAWRQSPHPIVRGASVEALGALATPQAREAVLDCVADPDETVRLSVVRALANMVGDEVAVALKDMCRDPSLGVRRALAESIVKARHLELADTLMSDPEDEVRTATMLSLLAIQDAPAIERFVEVAEQQDERLLSKLSEMVSGHPAKGGTERIFMTARRPETRRTAFRALMLARALSFEVLERAVSDPIAPIRVAAAEACVVMDHPEVEGIIEKLLRDPDPEVRDTARKHRVKLLDSSS